MHGMVRWDWGRGGQRSRPPRFNVPSSKAGSLRSEHKEEGMVDVKHAKCALWLPEGACIQCSSQQGWMVVL